MEIRLVLERWGQYSSTVRLLNNVSAQMDVQYNVFTDLNVYLTRFLDLLSRSGAKPRCPWSVACMIGRFTEDKRCKNAVER